MFVVGCINVFDYLGLSLQIHEVRTVWRSQKSYCRCKMARSATCYLLPRFVNCSYLFPKSQVATPNTYVESPIRCLRDNIFLTFNQRSRIATTPNVGHHLWLEDNFFRSKTLLNKTCNKTWQNSRKMSFLLADFHLICLDDHRDLLVWRAILQDK